MPALEASSFNCLALAGYLFTASITATSFGKLGAHFLNANVKEIAVDEIEAMIHDCEERESKLSDWERGFIDSIGVQFSRGNGLSVKQIEKLEAIWNRVT
jgi:hypothetical protein